MPGIEPGPPASRACVQFLQCFLGSSPRLIGHTICDDSKYSNHSHTLSYLGCQEYSEVPHAEGRCSQTNQSARSKPVLSSSGLQLDSCRHLWHLSRNQSIPSAFSLLGPSLVVPQVPCPKSHASLIKQAQRTLSPTQRKERGARCFQACQEAGGV